MTANKNNEIVKAHSRPDFVDPIVLLSVVLFLFSIVMSIAMLIQTYFLLAGVILAAGLITCAFGYWLDEIKFSSEKASLLQQTARQLNVSTELLLELHGGYGCPVCGIELKVPEKPIPKSRAKDLQHINKPYYSTRAHQKAIWYQYKHKQQYQAIFASAWYCTICGAKNCKILHPEVAAKVTLTRGVK